MHGESNFFFFSEAITGIRFLKSLNYEGFIVYNET
jgi:hypothetical protein